LSPRFRPGGLGKPVRGKCRSAWAPVTSVNNGPAAGLVQLISQRESCLWHLGLAGKRAKKRGVRLPAKALAEAGVVWPGHWGRCEWACLPPPPSTRICEWRGRDEAKARLWEVGGGGASARSACVGDRATPPPPPPRPIPNASRGGRGEGPRRMLAAALRPQSRRHVSGRVTDGKIITEPARNRANWDRCASPGSGRGSNPGLGCLKG